MGGTVWAWLCGKERENRGTAHNDSLFLFLFLSVSFSTADFLFSLSPAHLTAPPYYRQIELYTQKQTEETTTKRKNGHDSS
jgi:hypothetical protein